VIEDIDMHGTARAPSFGRSVADSGFGMFRNMPGRKPEEQGRKLIVIDGFHPSGKTSSGCGAVKDAPDCPNASACATPADTRGTVP
jgi:transposase